MELQRAILSINIADAGKSVSDRKKIIVMINSPGGLLTETMSVAMSMVTSVTPVITVNVGAAYSGGALLLLAGHERYAFKYAKQCYIQVLLVEMQELMNRPKYIRKCIRKWLIGWVNIF